MTDFLADFPVIALVSPVGGGYVDLQSFTPTRARMSTLGPNPDPSPGLYISIPVSDTGTDVTLVIRHRADQEDEDRFLDILMDEIAPLLPISCTVCGPVVMRGYANSTPTYDVRFADAEMEASIADIYAREYRQLDGYTSFPMLSPHVTVDTPERMERVDQLICCGRGEFFADRAAVRHIGKKEVVYEARVVRKE